MTSAHVFVGAFACEPFRGSEPGAGWELVRAAAVVGRDTGARVTVLTRPHRIEEIARALHREHLDEAAELVSVPVPLALHRILGSRRVRLVYVAWQLRAALELRRRYVPGEPSVYHHATFATAGLPTLVAALPQGVRVVFGPANGSSPSGPIASPGQRFRPLLQRLIGWSNVRRADLAVAQNFETASEWARWCGEERITIEPNIALNDSEFERIRDAVPQRDPRHIVAVGILEPRKQHELVIKAMSEGPLADYHLTLVGDGSHRARLQQLAIDTGVADRVEFAGWLPREAALARLAGAACSPLLSWRDGAPWSVGEAQALGVPPVVLGGTGPAGIVRLAGVGICVNEQASSGEVAVAIVNAAQENPQPTSRWSRSRLPELLMDWYDLPVWSDSREGATHGR